MNRPLSSAGLPAFGRNDVSPPWSGPTSNIASVDYSLHPKLAPSSECRGAQPPFTLTPSRRSDGKVAMRYMIAWFLGVPLGVIVLWFIVGHAACGH